MNKLNRYEKKYKALLFMNIVILIGLIILLALDNVSKLVCIIFLFLCLILLFNICLVQYQHTKSVILFIENETAKAFKGEKIDKIYEDNDLSVIIHKLDKFTNMRNAETEEKVKQQQQIEEFISDISHQIITPMSNIILFSNLLREQNNNLEQHDFNRYISIIIKNTEKMEWLIKNLVNISRFENGLIKCTKSLNNLDDIILASINEVFEAGESKGLTIFYPTLSRIVLNVDAKWTKEAIINILDNSIKYTNYGNVQINVISYELYVCIQIQDTGIGIRETEYAKIFGRFYRSDLVVDYPGVGVGLYLSREIIKKQCGYITVKSILGKGSTFSIFLPLN